MVLNQASQQAADGGVVIGNENAYCHGPGGGTNHSHYAASNCPSFNTVNTRLPGLPRQMENQDGKMD
jgi:hypothetical protein